MSVRSGKLIIDSATGPKKLSDILGVTESWSHVFVTAQQVGGTAGSFLIGDSNIATAGGGLGMVSPNQREFLFDTGDNPASELYFYNSSGVTQVQVNILAY
jgi:hypothetical protein